MSKTNALYMSELAKKDVVIQNFSKELRDLIRFVEQHYKPK